MMKLEPCFFCKKTDNIYIKSFGEGCFKASLICTCKDFTPTAPTAFWTEEKVAYKEAIHLWNFNQQSKQEGLLELIKAEDWLKEHG